MGSHNDAGDPATPAKVSAARKIVSRAKDLLAVTDDKLLAIKLIGWRSHTFRDESEPTKLAVLGVVDVSGKEPVQIGVVDVSWTRVVRLFEIVDPGAWQIGYLRRNEDANDAVELIPPDDGVDLEPIARMLGPLQLAMPSVQRTPPAGEQLTLDDEGEAVIVDDPFSY